MEGQQNCGMITLWESVHWKSTNIITLLIFGWIILIKNISLTYFIGLDHLIFGWDGTLAPPFSFSPSSIFFCGSS